jgi:hypothetical protein
LLQAQYAHSGSTCQAENEISVKPKGSMKICYVDEAGCTGVLPSASAPIQPVLVITGVIIDTDRIRHITDRLLQIKQRFFPKLLPTTAKHLAWMPKEIKGADLRRDACDLTRNVRRHTTGYLSEILKWPVAGSGAYCRYK